jgi:hypothetical protein
MALVVRVSVPVGMLGGGFPPSTVERGIALGADLVAVDAGSTDSGRRYEVRPNTVRVFRLPDLRAIKIWFPRPSAQGSAHDRDMHSGQQYVPLLDIEIA